MSLRVLTPHDGRMTGAFVRTLTMLLRADPESIWSDTEDLGLFLPHARNVLAAMAVNTSTDHVFWLDSDVAIGHPLRVLQIAKRYRVELEREGGAIVFPYRKRYTRSGDAAWDAVLRTTEKPGDRAGSAIATLITNDDGALVELQTAGMGAALFSADAWRLFIGPVNLDDLDWEQRAFVHAFDLEPRYGGEDTRFWRAWRSAGRRIWAWPWEHTRNGGAAGVYALALRDQYGFDLPEPGFLREWNGK